MATVTNEIEIASSFPAEKVFKVFKDFENVAPKVNPAVFKSVETLEGNGGVGTIKLFTFGDAVPFTHAKYKVDAFDESSFSYSYTFFEGDNLMGILDSVTQHVKITPSGEGSIYKQTIIYKCKGDEKPSKETLKAEKELYEQTYKAIEAYAATNPELY
ncbi:putative Bet v I/Major latex protein [Helianthus annuus]|uniref:Bet v I/Major latex protein n=1 Tax=Helianthus annuus TaxID=4232 RepID=A0A251RYE5_HELAN|nr:root allergen protein [Helianthus annuus]KAF5759860.1 putative Bet v I/Major latex protein [Helianthus annuus]KAJ0437983.1 putative Bet v I/Major latex protein [Helianthus annuus]KAJ0442586.1 putative Bet v I/Major latex protein [Helianthus annuus]KAJ0460312.1 putative Bet v I/Major latex protein [Helianthus annuus]KAJ0640755.1 putative Bet v I/Major latex protein [Helianthus annuus]